MNNKVYTNIAFKAFHIEKASKRDAYREISMRCNCPLKEIYIYTEPFSVMNKDADLLSSVKLVSSIEKPERVFALYLPLSDSSVCSQLSVYQTTSFIYPIIIVGGMWSSWAGVYNMMSTFEKNTFDSGMIQLQHHTFKLEKTSIETDVALVVCVCTESIRQPLEIPSIEQYYRNKLMEYAGRTMKRIDKEDVKYDRLREMV